MFLNILTQSIHCGYTLEPTRRGDSNEFQQCIFVGIIRKKKVDPCIPQFCHIKVGFKGVYNSRICYPGGATVSFHYENMTMQYIEIFSVAKFEKFIRKCLVFFLFLLKT